MLKPRHFIVEIDPHGALLAVLRLPTENFLAGSNAMSKILREKFHKKPKRRGKRR